MVRVTLLLGVLALGWRWLPADRPALRRAVLLMVAAFSMLLPWLPGWWAPAVAAVPATASGHAVFPWMPVLWAAGVVVATLRWSGQALALRRLVRGAREIRPPAACGLPVRVSAAVSGPCVAGVWRPVLLVPVQAREWTADEWEMVLAHESQHLRQGDLPAAWLVRAAVALHWWHPLAHWLGRQFHLESEALCDRAAAPAARHVRHYVEFLLALDAGRLPVGAVAMGRPSRLRERVARLVAGPRAGGLLPGVVALAALVTIGGAVALWKCAPSPAPESVPEDDTALRLTADPFPADQ